MNASNSSPESAVETRGLPPAAMSLTRPLYWSVRRELWENRSIYVAPLVVAVFVLIGFLISTIGMPGRRRALLLLDPDRQRALVSQPYNFAMLLIMGVSFVVGVFYCLDALHGERRDRSILFWKSLPVSDFTTVLSKAIIPFVILPLVTYVVTVATELLMLLWTGIILMPSGLSGTTAGRFNLSQQALLLLYHLVTVHVLWYAPFYGWLLLVSAWARRAAILWAGLPLLAIGIVEKLAFNTMHFASLLRLRLNGGMEAVTMPGTMPMDPMTHLTPGHFLGSPGLWIGLALTAAFLFAAARLRRYREPI